jgi:hypothetical protein
MSLTTGLLRPLLLACVIALVSTGCGTITRTERDVYTATTIDTLVTERVNNPPGERDNGIIAPSARAENRVRTIGYADSISVREYPNFIRWCMFEGVSLVGSADANSESTKTGLFGLNRDINDVLFGVDPQDTSFIFDGYLYRFGLTEWKLDWFDHAPDWSWGVTAFEIMRPDNDNILIGAGVLTVNKRFYLRKRIPYITIRPSVSLAMLPTQYVNPSVSAEIGSIGGVNLRAYVGYAFGSALFSSASEFITVPYAGIGVSVLDFLNREEELDTEWKYHEHSAWEVGLVEFTIIGSEADRSIFATRRSGADAPMIKGITGRLGIADVALPFLDYHLSLGTSLINTVLLGSTEYGISILPLRLTYHWLPFTNSFRVEPFAEVNFAPSSFFHAGVRMAFPIADQMSITLVAGWANGNTGSSVPGLEEFGFSIDQRRLVDPHFGAIYLGIGASLFDHLFSRKDLRYGKGYPHE